MNKSHQGRLQTGGFTVCRLVCVGLFGVSVERRIFMQVQVKKCPGGDDAPNFVRRYLTHSNQGV